MQCNARSLLTTCRLVQSDLLHAALSVTLKTPLSPLPARRNRKPRVPGTCQEEYGGARILSRGDCIQEMLWAVTFEVSVMAWANRPEMRKAPVGVPRSQCTLASTTVIHGGWFSVPLTHSHARSHPIGQDTIFRERLTVQYCRPRTSHPRVPGQGAGAEEQIITQV